MLYVEKPGALDSTNVVGLVKLRALDGKMMTKFGRGGGGGNWSRSVEKCCTKKKKKNEESLVQNKLAHLETLGDELC